MDIRGLLSNPTLPIPTRMPSAAEAWGAVKGLLTPPDPYDEAGKAVEQYRAGRPVDAFATMIGSMPGVGIIPVPEAKRLNVAKSLPASDTFERAVASTPGARVEDGSLVLPVARRQMSVQHNQPSVRGGVFYLPQGDKRLSHYNGTGWYGGQDKIA